MVVFIFDFFMIFSLLDLCSFGAANYKSSEMLQTDLERVRLCAV